MKKAFFLLIAITLLASLFTISASAARSLTADELRLIEELQGKEVLGQQVTAADLNAFENYLMSTADPIAPTEVNAIINDIDEVVAIVKSSGATQISDLKKEDREAVLKIVESSAAVAGLSISVTPNASASASSIVVTDNSGTPVIKREDIIKKTGFDLSIFNDMYTMSVVFLAVTGASLLTAYVIKMKKVAASNA